MNERNIIETMVEYLNIHNEELEGYMDDLALELNRNLEQLGLSTIEFHSLESQIEYNLRKAGYSLPEESIKDITDYFIEFNYTVEEDFEDWLKVTESEFPEILE